jgi:hypothetical protein
MFMHSWIVCRCGLTKATGRRAGSGYAVGGATLSKYHRLGNRAFTVIRMRFTEIARSRCGHAAESFIKTFFI